jgi:hypothetical protein
MTYRGIGHRKEPGLRNFAHGASIVLCGPCDLAWFSTRRAWRPVFRSRPLIAFRQSIPVNGSFSITCADFRRRTGEHRYGKPPTSLVAVLSSMQMVDTLYSKPAFAVNDPRRVRSENGALNNR